MQMDNDSVPANLSAAALFSNGEAHYSLIHGTNASEPTVSIKIDVLAAERQR
jgi:hypothetical protein